MLSRRDALARVSALIAAASLPTALAAKPAAAAGVEPVAAVLPDSTGTPSPAGLPFTLPPGAILVAEDAAGALPDYSLQNAAFVREHWREFVDRDAVAIHEWFYLEMHDWDEPSRYREEKYALGRELLSALRTDAPHLARLAGRFGDAGNDLACDAEWEGIAFGTALARMLTPAVPHYLWLECYADEGIDEPREMDAEYLFQFVPLPWR